MADRYWVGGTGTWDSSTTTHWATSSGGAGGASAPVAGDNVIIDGHASGLNGGTITTDTSIAAVAFGALTTGAMVGTLTINNHNTSFTTWSNSGSGTRTINMGSGTMSLTGTAAFSTVLNFATLTNCTFNEGTSTVSVTGVATSYRALNFGGETIYNISIAPASQSSGQLAFTANVTCHDFTVTNTSWLEVSNAVVTVTNDSTITGSAAVPTTITLTSGTAPFVLATADTWTYVNLLGITRGGAGSLTCNNSFISPSTGTITVNNPSSGGGSQRIIGG